MRPIVVVAVSRLVPERRLTRILPMFALMTVLITSSAASEPVAAQEANRTALAAEVCREWDEIGWLNELGLTRGECINEYVGGANSNRLMSGMCGYDYFQQNVYTNKGECIRAN